MGDFLLPEEDEDKEKKRKLGLLELDALPNLIDLATRSMQPIIHHIKFQDENIYYIQFGGLPGFGTTIYFIRQKEQITQKYIVYNKTEDSIQTTDKLDSRGNLIFLPIIHIKKQNIFSDEELKEFLEK